MWNQQSRQVNVVILENYFMEDCKEEDWEVYMYMYWYWSSFIETDKHMYPDYSEKNVCACKYHNSGIMQLQFQSDIQCNKT